MKIYAPLNAIKAISNLAATKDIRYYLNGVYIRANATQTTIVATDGHVLGVYKNKQENEIDDGQYYDFILPLDTVKNLKPAHRIKDELVEFEFTPIDHMKVTSVKVNSVSIKMLSATVDGRFPDWQRVLVKEVSNTVGNYDPELLARFIKVAKEFDKKPHDVILHQNGDNSAAITIDQIYNFIGVIMPIRSSVVPAYEGCTRFFDQPPVIIKPVLEKEAA